MPIEEKLDQIIEILLRIEKKIGMESINNISPIPDKQPQSDLSIDSQPTKKMIDFQRRMELMNRMDKNSFFTWLRKNAVDIMEELKSRPGSSLNFVPQTLVHIDKEIEKSPSLFYKDLKDRTEKFAMTVEAEGLKVLKRRLSSLNARAQ